MDFGMPTLIELPSLRENAALCAQLGLSFVEMNMNLPQFQLAELGKGGLLSSLTEEYGCYFTLHLDENLDPFCINPLVSQAWRQTALDAAAFASQSGIPLINMHMHKGVYFTLPDRREFLYQTFRDRYLSEVKRFRDEMTEQLRSGSTVICIENTDGYTDFQREAIDLMLESSCFGLTWDIGHSFCADEQDIEYLSRTHADRLMHMHFHDASGHSPHLPLGTGELDLRKRFSVAKEHGCRCVIEVKTAASLSESVHFLREDPHFTVNW